MSENIEYRIKGHISLNDLIRIVEKAKSVFSTFNGFSEDDEHNAFLYPERLVALSDLGGFAIRAITTNGYLPLKDDSIDLFKEVFGKGREAIGSIGLLIGLIGFEERNSQQSKRGYDTVNIRLENGKQYFSYNANGSKVLADLEYRRMFMQSLVHKLELPVRIVEDKIGFKLIQSDSKELKVLRSGFHGENPSGFMVELSGISDAELVNLLKKSIKEFASQKRFEFEWSVLCSGYPDKDTSLLIYDKVRQAGFPAKSYELQVEYSLKSIQGLEVLRKSCGKKDVIFFRPCGFSLPEDDYCEVVIVISTSGYELKFSFKNPDNLHELEQKLGLTLEEAVDR